MLRLLTSWCSVLCAFALMLAVPERSVGQMVNDANQLGIPPQGTFGGSDFDLVSFQNGNLHVTIPIQSLPQRNGKTYAISFVYDIPSWTLTGDYSGSSGPVWNVDQPTGWGQTTHFRLVTPFSYHLSYQYDTVTCSFGMQGVQDQFVLTDPTGAMHPLYLEYTTGGVCGAPNVLKSLTLDGTGTLVDISQFPNFSATLKDGTTVIGAGINQEDSNGNLMSASSDMLLRNPLIVANVGSQTYTTPDGVPAQGPQYQTWTYTDSNNTSQVYTLYYQAIDIKTNFCQYQLPPIVQGDCSEYVGTYLAPRQLVLPQNAGTYGFTWVEEGVGELQQITLPTGGNISYTYNDGFLTVQKANPAQCPTNPAKCIATVIPRKKIVTRAVYDGQRTSTWNYVMGPGFGGATVTDPLGNKEIHQYELLGSSLNLANHTTVEHTVTYFDPSGNTLRTESKDYLWEASPGCITSAPYDVMNIRQIRLTTTLPNNLVEKQETDYETVSTNTFDPATTCPYTTTYLNPMAVRDYDWGSGAPSTSPLRQTIYTYLHTNNSTYISSNITNRILSKTVEDGSGNQVALTYNEYDNYNHPNQPMMASNAVQHDSARGTSFWYRGNITAVSRWLNTTNTHLRSTNQYDDAGNVLSTIDPNGNKTSFDFTDFWTNTGCNPSGQGKAYLTTVTNALGQIMSHNYYGCTGLVGSTTDPNLEKTSYSYDFLDRHTQSSFPDMGSINISYPDLLTTTTTTAMLTNPTVLNKVVTVKKDMLGRVSQTQLTSDPSGTDYTDTTYDALGRESTQSNPYRTTSDPTYGLTTNQYDGLSRVMTLIPPDGNSSSDNVSTVYDIALTATTPPANCMQVTDEAGKVRKSCTDGIGRLTYVFEDPNGLNLETDYTYNPLDDLLTVTQKGGSSSSQWRNRSFQYDSLSRLTQAVNPESGSIAYSYDADNNLLTRTAPSPNLAPAGNTVTTSYTYDAVNRLTGKTYADTYTQNPATPAVMYAYDGADISNCPIPIGYRNGGASVNVIGRRSAMCYAGGNASWHYDQMGRILTESDRFSYLDCPCSNIVYSYNGVSYTSTYTWYSYYLNGDLLGYEYPGPNGPSNYEFYTEENAAGEVTDTGDAFFNVVKNGKFTATGQLASGLVGWVDGSGSYPGNPISNSYNNRLQPVTLSVNNASGSPLLNLTYNFNLGTSDNGNVLQIANGKDDNRTQNFLYDSLNRIEQAYTNGANWGETYSPTASAPGVPPSTLGIDPWGNLTNRSGVTGKTGSENALNCPANTSNQLYLCFTYDAAGNMIQNGSITYTYDAENRLIATGGMSYIYDGDGNRIEKCTQGATPGTCATNATGTLYWNHQYGGVMTESDLSGNWTAVYGVARGQVAYRVDLPGNVPHYYLHDHLNSTNVVLDALGNIQNESDYYPYGGEIVISSGDSNRYKFTGKERDAESGLDNFGARYDASSLGRFMTPDSGVDQHPEEPQSWNLYAYARNNPLLFVDPSGEYICGSSMTQQQCTDFQKGLDTAQQAANAAKDKYGADSDQYKEAQRAIDAYGKAGVDNGVTIQVGDTGKYGATTIVGAGAAKTADNPTGQKIEVKFSAGLVGDAMSEAHEGSHTADGSAWVASGFSPALNPSRFQTEQRAYRVTDTISEGLGNIFTTMSFGSHPTHTYMLDHIAWPTATKDAAISNIIKHEYPNSQVKAFQRNTRGGH